MIFRWSIWGKSVNNDIELLKYSILSFQKQFGLEHQYIVYTDDLEYISDYLGDNIDVRKFSSSKESCFCIYSKATWLKWCPSSRLDINQTEVYVDSDVFLLKYPREVDLFLSDSDLKFAILDEFQAQPFQHGAMYKKSSKDTPFVNAGFFIQKAGFDISNGLLGEYDWWKENISEDEQTHHDEQGALSIALTKYLNKGELLILPKDKYMIISKTSNPGIENIDEITLFHATYPDHPAFYKFKNVLNNILSIN